MENVVSARRLRKSMINSASINTYSYKRDLKEERKISFVDKLLIKSAISSLLLFITIITVNIYGSKLITNDKINRIYQHYNYNFGKEKIIDNFENCVKSLNNVMGDIIPKSIKEGTLNLYFSYLKPFIMNCNIKKIFSDEKNNEVEIYVYGENNLVGNENILNEEKITTEYEMTIENISKILPTSGVITSRFGEREKIFDELSNYHTGIDIANKIGTEIISSTSGVVSKIKNNDKYYGNYIEINSEGFIFKYAHLSEILVKENAIINQGELIAKMGSTGMSTGPHLHFEIIVDGKAIDPESVMKFE